MVRNYKRTTERASWSKESMLQAMEDVKSKKTSLRKAAKAYGIPLATLRKRIIKGQEDVINLGRFKPTFNYAQEKELKEHLLSLEKLFYGINLTEFRKIAFEYAEVNKIQHNFNKDKKIAGKQWAQNFLKRVGGLSIRTPEATSMARVSGFSRKKVMRFYELLKDVMEKHNFKPDKIFNLDETGVSIVQRPGKILAKKGKKQVGRITSAERGKTATVVACVSAFGSFIPPVIIYKRVRMNAQLLDGGIPGTIGLPSATGWIDTDIYYKVIQHFIQCTRATKEEPSLLIVDGHSSHKSLQSIRLCREYGINVITLPPHTTNRMQPLDVTVFGPFKLYLNQEMDKWMTNNPGRRITEYDMGPMIGAAFMKAATPNNITSGFQKSGILPFNPDVFSDVDFQPANAVNAHEIPCSSSSVQDNAHQGSQDNLVIEKELNVSITELWPLPKAQHQSSAKTRQQQKAEIITSSPYEKSVSEKEEQLRSKKSSSTKRKLFGGPVSEPGPSGLHLNKKKTEKKDTAEIKHTNKKQRLPKKLNGDNNEDCVCMYCEEKYSASNGECWICCDNCRKWSHEACTDADTTSSKFICDLCR